IVSVGSNCVINLDGYELLAFFEQNKSSSSRIFPRVTYGLLVNIVPLAMDVNRGTLQREAQGIAINLLEKRTTHAETPVIHGPALAGQLKNHILNGVVVHAIALDEPDMRRDHLPALAVHFVTELFGRDVENLFEDGDRIAAVRANDQRAITMHDFFPQLAAP